jgi:hypothetical protein
MTYVAIRICNGEFVFFVDRVLDQNRNFLPRPSVWDNSWAKPDWAWFMVERKRA